MGWVNPEDIDDDAWIICTYGMGSIAPHTPEVQEKMKKMGYTDIEVERALPEAVKRLEKYIGKEIDAIVAIELGGINTPAPIDAAARLGKKINGDYAGRAIPEIVQTTPSLTGENVCPITSIDRCSHGYIIRSSWTCRLFCFMVNNTWYHNSSYGKYNYCRLLCT